MTISEFPRPSSNEPDSAPAPTVPAAEPQDAENGPGTTTRRWWQTRRRETSEPARPLISSEDLERLTSDLYRIRSRLSQPSPQESRLRARLAVATRELEVLAADKATRRRPWAKASAALLGDTRTALEARQIIEGWQLLRAAERHMIEGRDAEELGDDLVAIRRRLSALAPNAAEALPTRRPKDPESARALTRRARAVLDAYLDELERLVHQKARMLGHAAVLLASMLIIGGALVLFDLPVDVEGTVLARFGTYTTIVGLGLAGAIVSRSIAGESEEGQLVQAAMNPTLIHVLRLSLGGAAALVLLLFLQSDLQGVVSAVGFNAYPFAVAAGFAERLVDRVFARTERSCEALAARAVGIEDA